MRVAYMFGNPQAERMALEATYEDIATVSRTKPKKGEDGITRTVPDNVYTGIICALSKNSDSSAQTDAQQNIQRDMTLFTGPDMDIRAGDTVTVQRFGRVPGAGTFTCAFEVVGVPVRYLTHQEIALKDVTIA